ncbi:MAG: threonine/serine dehydratase [Rhodobacteraceae bacterium]|nr:threonine/serine dehydratase [Paracoccaceae bacterium]
MISRPMIGEAAARIKGHVRVTPMLDSPFLDEIAGRRVLVKAECLQHTGSFKFRGGWNAVSALPGAVRAKGVLAFSSGNHAQGVAAAARATGVPAIIVMPADAPALKIANTKALGAKVVLYDRATENREDVARRVNEDMTLIRPFDDPMVIAGQGTLGLELLEQTKDVCGGPADVLVCCGGGGLTGGVALALEGSDLCARPVEPEGFDDVARSLISGRREVNTRTHGSLCDAILAPGPGKITFPVMRAHCGSGLVVTEAEALRAMALAFNRLKIVVEPGGAVALAAALFHPDEIQGDVVIAVATGGNVDSAVFRLALDQFGGTGQAFP